jgi:hypothetical protein
MEAVFGILIVYAAAWAIIRGTQSAGHAVKGGYRKRVTAWTSKHPAASPMPAAVKVAAVTATILGGAIHAVRGFYAGAKAGWPEGWRRGEAWVQRRAARRAAEHGQAMPDQPTVELPHLVPGPDRDQAVPIGTHPSPARVVSAANGRVPIPYLTDDPATVPHADTAAVPVQSVPFWPTDPGPGNAPAAETASAASRRLQPVPDHGQLLDGNPAQPDVPAAGGTTLITTTEGNAPMAITTMTGGEVLNMQQLIAELEGIGKEAAADLEDAQADRQRAVEDANRIDNMVASLQAMDLDRQTLAEVGALADTAGQRRQAAEHRAAAAEARHAQAQTALKGVQDRHGLMAEAHANTPHAAEKAFYAG